MVNYTLPQWVLFFFIYCFLGWVWESAFVSVCSRKLVNRGFLKGPFLPIYGNGAICVLVVTIPFRDSIPLMCIAGMVSATLLEYVTGAVMERLFRVRYWDYSDKFMNLNGYICIGSTLCWGVMTVLVVRFFQVYIEKLVLAIDEQYITALLFVLIPIVTADFVTSFHAAIRLRNILMQGEKIREELQKLAAKKDELELAIRSAGEKAKEQLQDEMQELLIKTGEQKERMRIVYVKSIKGLLKRNPKAVSFSYREAFTELKQNVMEKIDEIRR